MAAPWKKAGYRLFSDALVTQLPSNSLKMSDEEIWLVKNDIYDLAFEFEINTGIEFSPIIKNEDQYEYWVDTLPFYRNVRDEGGEWSVNDEIEKYLADKSIQY